MKSEKIIAEAKMKLRREIEFNASYIYSSLHNGNPKIGDELSIKDVTKDVWCPRFAVEKIGYVDGVPYSMGTHYIWKIKFCASGIEFHYADNEGKIPFEPSVEELGRLCALCEKRIAELSK